MLLLFYHEDSWTSAQSEAAVIAFPQHKKKAREASLSPLLLFSASLIVGGSVISRQTLGYRLNCDENVFRGVPPPHAL